MCEGGRRELAGQTAPAGPPQACAEPPGAGNLSGLCQGRRQHPRGGEASGADLAGPSLRGEDVAALRRVPGLCLATAPSRSTLREDS